MISLIDPRGQVFLANLSQIEAANENTQEQISSGKKVRTPQDAPDEITQLLQLQAQLGRNTQIQTNLTNVQTSASAADQAISSILQMADQASTYGAEGVNASATQASRQELAQQVQGILNQVVSLSQTTIGGRYIFGGDSDQSPSYQLDSASPTGVDRLSTALNTSTVQDANGNQISTGLTAGQLFDHRNPDDTTAPDNFFSALNSLYTALTNNDSTAISSAIASLKTASAYVNTQQSFYGALQNRLTAGINNVTTANTTLTQQISVIRDTDFAQAALQLTQGQTELQAALSARSKVPHTSLFDFLG